MLINSIGIGDQPHRNNKKRILIGSIRIVAQPNRDIWSTSPEYSDRELRQSMSRKGNCWDNAPQESFFGHMKDEIGERVSQCRSFDKLAEIKDDYMDYYNNERYQWNLAKLSPAEYYQYYITGIYPLETIE